MQTQINAIIFDFGGVLVKWRPQNVFQRFFPNQPDEMEKFMEEIKFMEWNAQQDKGRSFAEGVAALFAEFPQYAHIIRGFHENWEETLDGEIHGSIEWLQTLKQKGYLVYGLSNWSAETLPIARKHYTFFNMLDGMVISGEEKMIKPDPAFFELCLQRMGRSAQECLFIDDSAANIIAANKMGFDTVHFKSPEQLGEEIKKRNLL